MDLQKLSELLQATIDPARGKEAESQLRQVQRAPGFFPALLRIVVSNQVDPAARLAGVIFLKNCIDSDWASHKASAGIHEQDKMLIRSTLVDATVHAPELIKVHLALCTAEIAKQDFPERWPQIVDKINAYLRSPEAPCWSGTLLILYRLVSNFAYKVPQDRAPLHRVMAHLLPPMHQLFLKLLADPSDQSVLLQKQMLKIFYALSQHTLPLNVVTRQDFSHWMSVILQVVDRPIPPQVDFSDKLDDDDRAKLACWKSKKWALRILERIFEQCGSTNTLSSPECKEFSEWYLKNFTATTIEVILKILDRYRKKLFVPDRVLHHAIKYLDQGISHSLSWKFLKTHMFVIVQDVLFPMMSLNEEDEDLWEMDPCEYIRAKFDIYEEFQCHVKAAQLLKSACRKRKDMLSRTVQLCVTVLSDPNADRKHKDGAMYMIGALAEILLKRNTYKDQVDEMILQCLLPQVGSPHGHLKARAFWTLQFFANVKFKQDAVLMEILKSTTNALLNERELPVQAEAAIALQKYLHGHEKAQRCIKPWIKEVILKLLEVIRMTENEDLTTAMQKIVYIHRDELVPVAAEICQHLALSFSKIFESGDFDEERIIAASGLLSTIETVVSMMGCQPAVMVQLQSITLDVINFIFNHGIKEFYEEALTLVFDLTHLTISDVMWKVLSTIHKVFQSSLEYFIDMMPCLHNYVTVDTFAFVSNEHHVLAVFDICKAVLSGSESCEDSETHAAKLLECMVLQCKGFIDNFVPSIMQVVFERLFRRNVKTSELRTMCLQVVIAALYCNPSLCLQTINRWPQGESIVSNFIKLWISDVNCFFGLHDRKLCVLGLCTVIGLGPLRPRAVDECASLVIPALIGLFKGLKAAYIAKAADSEHECEDDEDTDLEAEILSSDEDEMEDAGQTERPPGAPSNPGAGDDEDNKENARFDEDDEETSLEAYTTPLDSPATDQDEFVVFQDVLRNIERWDPGWYRALTSQLNLEDKRFLTDVVLLLADQRRAALESKRIERSGGYAFTSQAVPTTFKFGGPPGGSRS